LFAPTQRCSRERLIGCARASSLVGERARATRATHCSAVDEEEDGAAALSLPTMLLGYRSPQRALCRTGFLGLQRLEAKGAVKKAVAAHNALLVENGQKRAETLAQTVSGGVRTHAIRHCLWFGSSSGFIEQVDKLSQTIRDLFFDHLFRSLPRCLSSLLPAVSHP
jgi:hypothetical protein